MKWMTQWALLLGSQTALAQDEAVDVFPVIPVEVVVELPLDAPCDAAGPSCGDAAPSGKAASPDPSTVSVKKPDASASSSAATAPLAASSAPAAATEPLPAQIVDASPAASDDAAPPAPPPTAEVPAEPAADREDAAAVALPAEAVSVSAAPAPPEPSPVAAAAPAIAAGASEAEARAPEGDDRAEERARRREQATLFGRARHTRVLGLWAGGGVGAGAWGGPGPVSVEGGAILGGGVRVGGEARMAGLAAAAGDRRLATSGLLIGWTPHTRALVHPLVEAVFGAGVVLDPAGHAIGGAGVGAGRVGLELNLTRAARLSASVGGRAVVGPSGLVEAASGPEGGVALRVGAF